MPLSGKISQLPLKINFPYVGFLQAKDNSVNNTAPITTTTAPITNLKVTFSNFCKNKNDIPATNNGLVCIIGKTIVTGPEDIATKYATKNPVLHIAAINIHFHCEPSTPPSFGNFPLHQR